MPTGSSWYLSPLRTSSPSLETLLYTLTLEGLCLPPSHSNLWPGRKGKAVARLTSGGEEPPNTVLDCWAEQRLGVT